MPGLFSPATHTRRCIRIQGRPGASRCVGFSGTPKGGTRRNSTFGRLPARRKCSDCVCPFSRRYLSTYLAGVAVRCQRRFLFHTNINVSPSRKSEEFWNGRQNTKIRFTHFINHYMEYWMTKMKNIKYFCHWSNLFFFQHESIEFASVFTPFLSAMIKHASFILLGEIESGYIILDQWFPNFFNSRRLFWIKIFPLRPTLSENMTNHK